MTDDVRPKLGAAIGLRIATREALGRDDMAAVCVLNRVADHVYSGLGPSDARLYFAWATDKPLHGTEREGK